jgi:isopentenyl-diphosphate delta-isomerase
VKSHSKTERGDPSLSLGKLNSRKLEKLSELQKKISEFELRKHSHLELSLSKASQSFHSDLDHIELIHEALPEINFSEVNINSDFFGRVGQSPLFCSSMTAGNPKGLKINKVLARACAQKGWIMGLGSQRRELFDAAASTEIREIRKENPTLILLSNIGLSQAIHTPVDKIREIVENAEAQALIVHTNPLQEALQLEGTPDFRGGLRTLERLARELGLPVILKEVGCGFSEKTLLALNSTGVAAVDLAGRGGTHWGRVEGMRGDPGSRYARAAAVFQDWGISTVQSLKWAQNKDVRYQVWASGGVRSGLDAAKLLAMGARKVGLAKPLLEAALQGLDSLLDVMEQFEFELKLALFCVGARDLQTYQEARAYREIEK